MPRRKRTYRSLRLGETASRLFHPSHHNDQRPRVLHTESLLYFCFIVLATFGLIKAIRFFPGIERSILGYASNITAEQVLEQTNQQRVAQGLPALRLNNQLTQAALSKGQNMFQDQYWAHTSPSGLEPWSFIKNAGYAYKAAGENLARDFSTTGDMMSAWMSSPTHQENILSSKFQEIGIAVIDGSLGGFETTLVVQMFGTPAGAQTVATLPQPAVSEVKAAETNTAPAPTQAEKPTLETETAPTTVYSTDVVEPVSRDSVLLTPLQLTKAFFLAVVILIAMTLVYDTFIASHRKALSVVRKNLGHLMLFGAVTFIIVFFRSGVVNS